MGLYIIFGGLDADSTSCRPPRRSCSRSHATDSSSCSSLVFVSENGICKEREDLRVNNHFIHLLLTLLSLHLTRLLAKSDALLSTSVLRVF